MLHRELIRMRLSEKMVKRLREISVDVDSGSPPPGLRSSQSENALARRGLLTLSRFNHCDKPYTCYVLTDLGKKLVEMIERYP
jgi:hypothetical protein